MLENGQSALKIKEQFDRAFSTWGVELPRGAAEYRAPGWLQIGGWSIAFVWGEKAGSIFLDYEAEHRMTDPRHIRLWGSGSCDELNAPMDTVPLGISPSDEQVAAAIAEAGSYNRGIHKVLLARGLWPWDEVSERREHWEANGLDPHELFARATATAAKIIDTSGPKASFLEARVERALVTALTEDISAELIGARQSEFAVPGWVGNLGGIDLYVRHGDGRLRIAAELKVDDVEWVLWDLFKAVNTFELGSVDAAFLVVAAERRVWSSDRDCVALFAGQPGSCLRWDSRQMLRDWSRSWDDLLTGGSARPTHVPAAVDVEVIAHAPVPAYANYELRVAAVRPVAASGRVEFAGDWPAPTE